MNRCLYCYNELSQDETDFHTRCSKRFFGTATPPLLPYTEDQLEALAATLLENHEGVTGVQPKIALGITKDEVNYKQKLTIVGALGGEFILKPHTKLFPTLPEVEDLTMHMAAICGITTVPHSLIRMQSGSLAYITKRIDRNDGVKFHMEDMCQLTERLTEDKYKGSYEQIARAIDQYSANPTLDVINFFEQVLFCFLTGNADMHLKNFSLFMDPQLGPILSPAYDMVSTALVMPEDNEDLALNLNGKKKKITLKDFQAACNTAKLSTQQQENLFAKMKRSTPGFFDFIDKSFLGETDKETYKQIINTRMTRLGWV